MRLIDADVYAYPGDLINEPTIEANPVRRGYWIIGTGENALMKGYRMCSRCGETVKYEFSLFREHNFCNFCGAKLDEERE